MERHFASVEFHEFMFGIETDLEVGIEIDLEVKIEQDCEYFISKV
jgi:hypothetical protein